jgi:hypothetical protein
MYLHLVCRDPDTRAMRCVKKEEVGGPVFWSYKKFGGEVKATRIALEAYHTYVPRLQQLNSSVQDINVDELMALVEARVSWGDFGGWGWVVGPGGGGSCMWPWGCGGGPAFDLPAFQLLANRVHRNQHNAAARGISSRLGFALVRR